MRGDSAPQTSNNEMRQDARVSVNVEEQKNLFFIEFAGQTIPINNISNVSISGIALHLDNIIAQGETIQLCYQSDDLNLKVNGSVAWCDATDGSASLGIEFTRDTSNENMLFFMAMRKYLDKFDGTTTDI